ncbi:MAG: iron-containing alcohol dehydrogenase [Elusimicrobia bacterium]|nr:iron-containing alcohol dehydrogenase [Elusimicrobiota bacterium]
MPVILHRYNFPTEVWFGAGARGLLPDKLKEAGVRRPLLVSDKGVSRQPFFDDIRRLCGAAAVYAEISGNPVESHARGALEAYDDGACDGIVAVGGGAAIDVAKAVAVMTGHKGRLFSYAEGVPGQKPISGKVPPILALPTTAGTGSEVGRSTVISEDDSHVKRIIFSPKLMPRAALLDPELTLGLPGPVTAATGMDAVTHLIESYITAGDYNPLCDGVALEGLRLAAKSLKRCVTHPGDVSARGDMMNAALMGATAFQKGLGATHSCAHALSTVTDMHHGLGNGIMIPTVMAFNRSVCRPRFKILEATVGARDLVAWLRALNKAVGIPATLAAAGVKKEALPKLVAAALADPCHQLNPRPVRRKDFERLFAKAWAG